MLIDHYSAPNPTRDGARIAFTLTGEALVHCRIFDTQKRLVWHHPETHFAAGSNVIWWDGSNSADRKVAAGMYYNELEVGGRREARKVVVLR